MPAQFTHDIDLHDEICRCASLDGVCVIQLVTDPSEATPTVYIGGPYEMTYLSVTRNADVVAALAAHYGVTALPATVVLVNREHATTFTGAVGPVAVTDHLDAGAHGHA